MHDGKSNCETLPLDHKAKTEIATKLSIDSVVIYTYLCILTQIKSNQIKVQCMHACN